MVNRAEQPSALIFQQMNPTYAYVYSEFFHSNLLEFDFLSDEERRQAHDLRTVEKLNSRMQDPNFLFFGVTDKRGKLMGTMEVRITTNPSTKEKMANIVWIITDKDLRNGVGGGIGRRMIGELEGRLRSLGCVGMISGIHVKNSNSISFHERLGFVPDTTLPWPVGKCWYKKMIS